jgi:membrane protein implicated in regulation of membrane protease activity
MCRSPKLWIALGVAAVVVALVAPNPGAVLPLLLVAACPLSMLVMMGGMAGMARNKRDDHNTTPTDTDELAQLRAEVADLRERAAR